MIRLAIASLFLSTAALAVDVPKEALPDPKLTPGAIDPKCSVPKVCKPGYTATVRNVSSKTKRAVMRKYGLDPKDLHLYEIDHLISLEVCGLNDESNLWPEPWAGPYTAREKDQLEDHLHREVCAGRMSLPVAQQALQGDWTKAYEACCHGKGAPKPEK